MATHSIREMASVSSIEKKNASDDVVSDLEDPDTRKRLERKLLRKIDARISILVVIYILNFVSIVNPSQPS
jgi:hypothetical protein